MSGGIAMEILTVVLAVLTFAYLLYAMVRPERF